MARPWDYGFDRDRSGWPSENAVASA